MRSALMVGIALAALAFAGAAQADEALAKQNGCLNCHAVDTKKMGPSYKDIAAKYKGKADAEAALVMKLSTAKGHPKVKAGEADVKALVKWILAM